MADQIEEHEYDALKSIIINMIQKNKYTFTDLCGMLKSTTPPKIDDLVSGDKLKQCKVCLKRFEIEQFRPNSRYCLPCYSEKQREFYQKNKDKYWHYTPNGNKRGRPKAKLTPLGKINNDNNNTDN
jgi:hypothetical protein